MSSPALKPAKAQRYADLARELHLTDKQRVFADALFELGNELGSISEAGRIADLGKNPGVQGSKMVKVPKVAAYLAELKRDALAIMERKTQRRVMDQAELLGRLSEHADFDAGEFITIVPPEPVAEGEKPGRPDWFIDIPKAIEAGKGHLIQEIGFDAKGLPKLKFPDRQGALDKLAKFHKLYDAEDSKGITVNLTLQQVLKEDPELVVDVAMRLLSESKEETR